MVVQKVIILSGNRCIYIRRGSQKYYPKKGPRTAQKVPSDFKESMDFHEDKVQKLVSERDLRNYIIFVQGKLPFIVGDLGPILFEPQ